MFTRLLRQMENGPSPISVLRGPRQVGKTTLQEQIIAELCSRRGFDARRILRVQFDDILPLRGLQMPIQEICNWFESRVLRQTFNQAARAGVPAFVFLDEVQNLPNWAPELKNLVDTRAVRVLVTGSSALRIEAGRDSLAGRISTIELGPLLLREVAALRRNEIIPPLLPDNGPDRLGDQSTWTALQRHGVHHAPARDRAFCHWSERGGYPLAQRHGEVPWSEIADNLIETVVNRAIQHDLRQGERGRKRDESLLREVFRLACRYTGQSPAQAVFIDDIRSSLNANLGWQRIQAYLRFLENAMLLRLVPPLELRLKRKRGAPKICICDHALRAAWLQELVPLDRERLDQNPHLTDIAGHIAEGAAAYFLSSIPHLDVAHFPARGAEPEVDLVLTVGERRIPVEIKYQRRIDPHTDTRGLRAFLEKSAYNAPFGVLVTLTDEVRVTDPRIVQVSLPSLLLLR